jgi:hypothetical protein
MYTLQSDLKKCYGISAWNQFKHCSLRALFVNNLM